MSNISLLLPRCVCWFLVRVYVTNVKRFSDDIGKQFDLEKHAKVTFKKGSLVKPKTITLDINTEITKFEHNKTYKYLGINDLV